MDASGRRWITVPSEDYRTAFWDGAYSTCTIHNLKVLRARGADVTSDAVSDYVDGICHKLANEMQQLRESARDRKMNAPEPTPFVCKGGCI